MPGSPNDYHITKDGALEPGLGKDELTETQRLALRSKGAARMMAMKDELEVLGAQLTEKEKELVEKEDAQIKRERELEARERELAKREAKLSKNKGADGE